MTATPGARDGTSFDLLKVNRLRTQVSRGAYAPDPDEVALALLWDHITLGLVVEVLRHPEPPDATISEGRAADVGRPRHGASSVSLNAARVSLGMDGA